MAIANSINSSAEEFTHSSGEFLLHDRVRYEKDRYENLGFFLSSGVFTVKGADGNDLSATNPGYVVFKSRSNPQQMIKVAITANQNFQDGNSGSSEITGNLFGTATTVAWDSTLDVPFCVYAVLNDDEDTVKFMISRMFGSSYCIDDSTKIGAPDDAVADTQASFFSFDNIDETKYEGNPAVSIGGIRMQKDGSDEWTIVTLTYYIDGVGKFYHDRMFKYPITVEGATSAGSGTYTVALGYYWWAASIKGPAYGFMFNLQLSAHTGTGLLKVKLPFVTNATCGHYGVIWLDADVTVPVNTNEIVLECGPNCDDAYIRTTQLGSGASYVSVDATSRFNGQGMIILHGTL